MNVNDFTGQTVDIIEAPIAQGADTTSAITLNGCALKQIYVPAAFTSTELTFEISYDGVSFSSYRDVNDTEISCTVSPGNAYGFDAQDFKGIQALKIITDQNEADDRILLLNVVPGGW